MKKLHELNNSSIVGREVWISPYLGVFMKRSMKRHADIASSFYQEIDPRRRLEAADGRLIHEDHNATANMPTKAFQRTFPRDMGFSVPFMSLIIEDK